MSVVQPDSLLRLKLRLILVLLLGVILLGSSALPPGNRLEHVRAFTRYDEFDYISWTLDALRIKLNQFALGSDRYLSADASHQVVLDYLDLVARSQAIEGQVSEMFSNPDIADSQAASQDLRWQLHDLNARRDRLAPVAEAVLQSQISQVVDDLGLSLGGQPVPPILFHSTPLPMALIVSPRNVIRQDEDISLNPGLSIDQQVALEERVDRALNVSSLVVPIGGVGVYPTMVYQTNDLNWLSEVIAHEWVHNFLTLRPLGLNYLTSPELRIMNETTASIAGKEIGLEVLERYYLELMPPPTSPIRTVSASRNPSIDPVNLQVFNYEAEMHQTRITADQLLAEGKIEAAEQYLEQRRIAFWNQGYHNLRKLNQAYFAFYGAYADQPIGAAGKDPVGAAVRTLRSQCTSLSEFLNRISWMSSFDQLRHVVGEG
jgi:hypothetical protein